ncbi:MAG TPA: hypothetical protein ENO21_02155 [Firmicutes bacterium]|nr:hypothetical protein [Bacillota bacterium]
MENNYFHLPGFEEVVLEESYVRRVVTWPTQLVIYLDLVLRPDHKDYFKPPPDEWQCYVDAKLEFCNVRSIGWKNINIQPTSDQDGIDIGQVHVLHYKSSTYYLFADFGEGVIESDVPQITVLRDQQV